MQWRRTKSQCYGQTYYVAVKKLGIFVGNFTKEIT